MSERACRCALNAVNAGTRRSELGERVLRTGRVPSHLHGRWALEIARHMWCSGVRSSMMTAATTSSTLRFRVWVVGRGFARRQPLVLAAYTAAAAAWAAENNEHEYTRK